MPFGEQPNYISRSSKVKESTCLINPMHINAYSHLWRTIMGRETIVAITNGKLDLGTWEQLFYGEFDGQREKRVLIKVIGE